MKQNKTTIAIFILAALTGTSSFAADTDPPSTAVSIAPVASQDDPITQAQKKLQTAQNILDAAQKTVDDAGPGATDAQKQALTDTLAQSKTINDNAQATLDAAQKSSR